MVMRSVADLTGAVPPFYFFQLTIVNHKSSIPMRPPLHARSTSQRYRRGVRLLTNVFLNAPFWGQNDAFNAQNVLPQNVVGSNNFNRLYQLYV